MSPESTPGESTSTQRLRIGLVSCAASKRLRNCVPKRLSGLNGASDCAVSALPGVTLSASPCMIATKRSVVGSGPTRWPGKSRPRR